MSQSSQSISNGVRVVLGLYPHYRLATSLGFLLIDSARPAWEVTAEVNVAFFNAYGPNELDRGSRSNVADPLLEYERVLTALKQVPYLKFKKFSDADFNRSPNGICCLIHHDIDGDIVGAIQQERIEAELGVETTWFVFHTAPYYGTFNPDLGFVRNSSMAPLYRQLQEYGQEVGLHTDPFLISQQ